MGGAGSGTRVAGVRLQLWRAAVAYRVATLLVAGYLIIRWHGLYRHAVIADVAGAGMVAVTAVIAVAGVTGRGHRVAVVAGDVLATAALTLLSVWAQTPGQRHGGMPTLTTFWAAGPALEAGIVLGWLGGAVAGAAQVCAAMAVRSGYDGRTLGSAVLIVVAGGITGFVAVQAVHTEQRLVELTASEAASRERERLARTVHDGVLQLLGLVQRQAHDDGGDGRWRDLAAEAAEQEARLRALVRSAEPMADGGLTDVAAMLRALGSARVSVAAPAHPVVVPVSTATEIRAAVLAAVDNTARHAGPRARAWVLLEELPDAVRVTVRDDGTGMVPGRLAEAEAAGRFGVSASIRGRIHALGGEARINSAPGAGTTVEMSVPKDGAPT